MAVVSLTHNIVRYEDFEPTAPGSFATIGGGPGASFSSGLNYEGTQCVQRRINSTGVDFGSWWINGGGTLNLLSANYSTLLCKTYTALTDFNNAKFRVASTSHYYHTILGDDGTLGLSYLVLSPGGGYIIRPWNVSLTAWHYQASGGSPDITLINEFAFTHDVNATTGAGHSQAMDSLDFTDDGLFLVGGDGSDADGTFQDFIDADEGAGLSGASRAGLWVSKGNAKFTYGLHVIGRTDTGTSTLTVFTDSFFVVIFPGGFVAAGFNGLEFDLNTNGTTVTLASGQISGEGRSDRKGYFDTELSVVGSTTDTIEIFNHGFEDGDQVVYSAEGGSEDIGPDATTGQSDAVGSGGPGTGDNWYVGVVDVDTIQLYATAYDPLTGGTPVDLTPSGSGNGENHSLRRQPDTRPDILFTYTSGTGVATFTDVSLVSCRTITLRSVVTFIRVQVVSSQQLILNDATLTNCTINAPTTPIGEAFLEAIYANDLNNIDGTDFISGGLGHAIEITTDGTTTQNTAVLDNVGFSGYFDADEDNTGGWSFNANTDVASNQITITGHGFSTGDPIYYSDEGGTAIGGLTDQNLYYIESIDSNTVEMHLSTASASGGTNPISLTAGSDETHKLYSANAAIFNNTGGDVIVNISEGDIPTVRNSAGSTTTVNTSETVTITVKNEGGNFLPGAQVIVLDDSASPVILSNQSTNQSGVSTFSFTGSTPQNVEIRIRLSTQLENISAAIVEDNGTGFADETADANSSTSNDIELMETTSPVANDAFYIGFHETFSEVYFDINTAATVGAGTWEYSQGSSTWGNLESTDYFTDNTSDFTISGISHLTFLKPADWATDTVNSQGPYYYIRLRATTAYTGTSPVGNQIQIGRSNTSYFPITLTGTIQGGGIGLSVSATLIIDNII